MILKALQEHLLYSHLPPLGLISLEYFFLQFPYVPISSGNILLSLFKFELEY